MAPVWAPNASTPVQVMLSAFMDGDRCAKTIFWGFTKALHPERVSFGVTQARTSSDVDCVEEFKEHYLGKACAALAKAPTFASDSCATDLLGRVKKKIISLKEAEGPSHQRSFQRGLLDTSRPDSFCTQLDSHMDFVPHWDQAMIADWQLAENEFAVLTGYPMDFGALNVAESSRVDCCGWFREPGSGIPRGKTCATAPRSSRLHLTPNWAAGFSFHRCHAEHNVPIDGSLEYIFTGEEIDRAARLWTHGYDMYLATRALVVHNYTHASQAFWEQASEAERSKKEERSRSILAQRLSKGAVEERRQGLDFGLGRQRSWAQYEQWMRPTTDLSQKESFWQDASATSLCSDLDLQRVPVASPDSLKDSAQPGK